MSKLPLAGQDDASESEWGAITLEGRATASSSTGGRSTSAGRLAPRRWDVVVFKNPNEPGVNYIKRLIGLPGETIEIIDGDIWVKPPGAHGLADRRERRARRQDALWIPVYEHDYIPRSTTGISPRLRSSSGSGCGWSDRRGTGLALWGSYAPRLPRARVGGVA